MELGREGGEREGRGEREGGGGELGREGGGREGGKKGEKIKFSVSKHYTVQYATMLTSQWW